MKNDQIALDFKRPKRVNRGWSHTVKDYVRNRETSWIEKTPIYNISEYREKYEKELRKQLDNYKFYGR